MPEILSVATCVNNNNIWDISPLAELEQLTSLHLSNFQY